MKQIPSLPPFHAKRGCAGCLVQCVLALAFGLAIAAALCVILAPWGFYLGGNFHLFPTWQGWGVVHEPEGDYVVRVWISPRLRGNRGLYLSGPSVNGSGEVCTPHGEIHRGLRLSGGFANRGIGLNTDGQPMSFSLADRLNFLGTNSRTRLNVNFRGAWHNPDLVMDDRGSLRTMFNADGTMFTGDPSKRPTHSEPVAVTFHEGGRSEFDAACAVSVAGRKH
jgi:hypothetical protein